MKLGEAKVGDRVSFFKGGFKTGTIKIVQGWDAYVAVDGGGRETMRLAALDPYRDETTGHIELDGIDHGGPFDF